MNFVEIVLKYGTKNLKR